MDFQDIAIKSADTYYKYLVQNNRGEERVQVIDIRQLKNRPFFALKLKSKLIRADMVEIKIGNKIYDRKGVEIVRYDNKRKELTVHPIGEIFDILSKADVDQVFVYSDMKYLVERVKEWYKKFGSLIKIPHEIESIPRFELNLKDKPSKDQAEAIDMVLSEPFSYVWGAPGTGKTKFVLARSILPYIKAKKRVVLLAPTNLALEQSLYGILDVLQEAGIEVDKKLLRLGVSTEVFFQDYPNVCESIDVVKKTEEIRKNISFKNTELEETKNEKNWFEKKKKTAIYLEQNISEIKKNALLYFDILLENSEIVRELDLYKNKRDEMIAKTDEYKKRKAIYFDNIQQIDERMQKRSIIRKVFARKKIEIEKEERRNLYRIFNELCNVINENKDSLEGIDSHIDILTKERKAKDCALSDVVDALKNMCYQVEKIGTFDMPDISGCIDFETLSEKFSVIIEREYGTINKSQNIFLPDYWRTEVEKNEKKINELRLFEKELSDELYELRCDEITQFRKGSDLSKYSVLAATVDTFIARIEPKEYEIAHIFLDEAAYCPMIKGCVLFGYGSPVTFLGDHMQLPPVCEMSDDKDIKNNIEVTLWNQSAIYAEQAFTSSIEEIYGCYDKNNGLPLKIMKKHDLIFTHRFGKNLASILAKEIYANEFNSCLDENAELFYINAVNDQKENKDRISLVESEVIYRYLCSHADENIGVLTPYVKQVELLKKKCFLFEDNILTVHRSQGREWNTVILSVADKEDKWLTRSTISKSNGKRIINTAISRAKKKLIIVCDVDYWKGQKRELISKLLNEATEIKIGE